MNSNWDWTELFVLIPNPIWALCSKELCLNLGTASFKGLCVLRHSLPGPWKLIRALSSAPPTLFTLIIIWVTSIRYFSPCVHRGWDFGKTNSTATSAHWILGNGGPPRMQQYDIYHLILHYIFIERTWKHYVSWHDGICPDPWHHLNIFVKAQF